MLKLKICGITRPEDAAFADESGADYVGVVLVPDSRRFVTEAGAKTIFGSVKHAEKVCVVRDLPLELAVRLAENVRPDVIQLHGNETPEYARALAKVVRVWRAFDFRDAHQAEAAKTFPCELVVADSGGGTGKPFDWTRAAELAETRFLLLAGGITPENAAEAVKEVHPFGLDVSGGVESSIGIKDHRKIQELTRRIGK